MVAHAARLVAGLNGPTLRRGTDLGIRAKIEREGKASPGGSPPAPSAPTEPLRARNAGSPSSRRRHTPSSPLASSACMAGRHLDQSPNFLSALPGRPLARIARDFNVPRTLDDHNVPNRATYSARVPGAAKTGRPRPRQPGSSGPLAALRGVRQHLLAIPAQRPAARPRETSINRGLWRLGQTDPDDDQRRPVPSQRPRNRDHPVASRQFAGTRAARWARTRYGTQPCRRQPMGGKQPSSAGRVGAVLLRAACLQARLASPNVVSLTNRTTRACPWDSIGVSR